MLDRDLAELYGVTTMALNQAVKRNPARFPQDFSFTLTGSEKAELITICDNPPALKFSPALPRVFTENGVAMLSSVIRSERAVAVNIQIMRTFTKLRQLLAGHAALARKIDELERKLHGHSAEIALIFEKIRELMTPPEPTEPARKPIGFRGRSG